ncbi:MAG: translation factor SUA5 [Magnetococcales bacterium]|nr:translation factor SUA5 [Magnetococcales bacterium]
MMQPSHLPDDLPSPAELARACEALDAGRIIAYPTETVFGLGADPFHPLAMEQILALKGRDAAKGFILLIQNRTDLETVALPPPPQALSLMQHFWPGPLTLVLPAQPGLPNVVTGGRSTVAVRHSSSRHVAALLHRWGKPLISTSANLSGHPPLTEDVTVRQCFGVHVDFTLSGCCPPGIPPTTIVAFDDAKPRIVRQGGVTVAMLRSVLPRITP